MNKNYFILYVLLLLPFASAAQNDLGRIYALVKNPYIKAEEIDAVIPQLIKIQVNDNDSLQRHMLFETYKLAADRYTGNTHFKQAYMLFQNYLILKEKFIAKEKARIITDFINQNEEKAERILAENKNLKSEISGLEAHEKTLKSRSSNFVRNVVLIIIFLAGLFALLFLRTSLKLKKIREELFQFRKQLLSLEKIALIGRLNEQVTKSSLKQFESAVNELNSLKVLFSQLETAMTKEHLTVLKKIKDSFSKAEIDLKILMKGQ